jgi:FkbM family methyltransferase
MFETIRGHTIYAPALNSTSVVIDLGANRGEFSKQLRAKYGGTYYLVEANPTLAAGLFKDSDFHVKHCAVASASGLIRFNIAQNDEGSSILDLPKASTKNNCVLVQTVEVESKDLETIIAEIGTRQIDLIKMDIEGAEVGVLWTLSDPTLAMIRQITVEFHIDPIFGFELSADVEDVICSLRSRGFLCLDFSGGTRINVLCLNRRTLAISWRKGKFLQFHTAPPPLIRWMWGILPEFIKSRLVTSGMRLL